jgi:hypothetical protein
MATQALSTQPIESGFLVGGKKITSGEPLVVLSPFDGGLVGSTRNAGAQDVENAVCETVRAFPEMREMPCRRFAAPKSCAKSRNP